MNIIEKAVAKLEAELDSEIDAVNSEAAPKAQPSAMEPKKADEKIADANTTVTVGAPAVPSPNAKDYGPVSAIPSTQHPESVSALVDINLESLSVAGFLTPDRGESLLAEQMRIVKRPLLARATPGSEDAVKDGNLIIVTSSLPGEGKTYCSINLAMSMAMEVDRTVLLVDADPAKSDVSKTLGLSARKGLTNFLSGEESDLSKLLVRTKEPSMSVLPSGPRHSRMTELMSSLEMRRLINELSSRYPERLVIFDSPPLLATSGAGTLVGLMGQVVLVVEAVRTPQSAIREALRQLGGARNIGVLYNKQRGGMASEFGYGYGYDGYGYGYGYGYGADKAKAKA